MFTLSLSLSHTAHTWLGIAGINPRLAQASRQVGRTNAPVLVEPGLDTGGLGRATRIRGARVNNVAAGGARQTWRAALEQEGHVAGAAVLAGVGGRAHLC